MQRSAFVYQVWSWFFPFDSLIPLCVFHSFFSYHIRCPQLRSLSLKRSNMVLAMLHCPLLQHLDIASCHKLQDADIRSAVTSCPQLESLDVSNSSRLSNETLREIAQACAALHILNASYCSNISFEVGVMWSAICCLILVLWLVWPFLLWSQYISPCWRFSSFVAVSV